MRIVNFLSLPKLKDYLGPLREGWHVKLRSLCVITSLTRSMLIFLEARGYCLRK